MKKLYEVRINKIEPNYGRPTDPKHIAWVTNERKAYEIAGKLMNELVCRPYWWMDIATDADGMPDVVVVEMGELVE